MFKDCLEAYKVKNALAERFSGVEPVATKAIGDENASKYQELAR